MQTQGMCVDIHFLMSLDKYPHGKKTFMQTQSIGVDLHFQISLDKCNWKKTFINSEYGCRSTL